MRKLTLNFLATYTGKDVFDIAASSLLLLFFLTFHIFCCMSDSRLLQDKNKTFEVLHKGYELIIMKNIFETQHLRRRWNIVKMCIGLLDVIQKYRGSFRK